MLHAGKLLRWSWLLAALLAALLAIAARADAVERGDLDTKFKAELTALADKCEALGLKTEAERTRAWFIERLPDRQYLFVPASTAPLPPGDELKRKWHDKFLALRSAQAEGLYALSKQYLAADDPTRAYQTLHEVLREDPDHAAARAVLGFRKADNVWRVPGATTGTRKASLAHGLVKDFKPGSYWRVTTAHFQVATDAGAAEGQKFGEQLERLHTVWRQAFFRFWSSGAELRQQFDRPSVASKPKKPLDVVLFKSREGYLKNLAAADPRLAVTQGIYLDKQATAFFYLGDPRTVAICNHEVTHQLFQETGDTAREVGVDGNFWIVEGIALYMESLRPFEHDGAVDVVTLGGWDADRLQFARHHVFNGRFQLPLTTLAAFTRRELQEDKDIKRLYSQSAGLTHYLMDFEQGKYREPTVTYLAAVYAGRSDAEMLAQLTETPFETHDQQYQKYLRVNDDDLLRIDAPLAIRNLCLGHQPVNDRGIARLEACKELRWLDLAVTPVTDKGLASLAKLAHLDQLNLEQTKTTDATLAWLGKQTQLRELDLSQTQVTDTGLAQLRALTNLQVLWLTGTAITDASAPVLQRFSKLQTLDLDGTRLSPATISKLQSALRTKN